MSPLPNTWVNIQEIARPNNIPERTASHFHFCHIRPTRGQKYIYKGDETFIPSETVCVIIGSEQKDDYLVATRQHIALNFSAADAIRHPSSFKWFQLSHRNFFDGPFQVYFFKANLLQVP